VEFISEAFGDDHDASAFDSGQPALDEWLRKSARHSDGRNLTRTYVWHRGDGIVVAYYSLMPFVIERETLTKKQGRGLVDHIPSYLIARLALDGALHGQGLGSQVLADALTKAAVAADAVGGRLVVVDAIDDNAAAFYRHHGFQAIGLDERRLVLPTKALREFLP
jgi:GNAT superfamily N-acetyltransferase